MLAESLSSSSKAPTNLPDALLVCNMNDTQRITCTACQVEIIGSEQRRIHYRSDLHLVNLKRKVGGLGPLTQPEFSRRVAVLTQNRQENGTDNENNDNDENITNQARRANKRRREQTVCEICRKTFSSRQAFLNHEKSKRHIDMLNRQGTDMSEISSNTIPSVISTARGADGNNLDREAEDWAWAEDDDDDELAVDEELRRRMQGWDDNDSDKHNVFDDNQPKCKDAMAALDQMWKTHGFFVPHKEYLTDPEGLVRYLAQKVLIGYACIACDKGFRSVEDVRKHMKDVGHCRMTSNEDAFLDEYGEFYTWTTSAKDKNEEDDDEQWQQVDDDGDLENNGNVIMVHPDHDDRSTLVDNTPIGRLQTHSHEETQPDVDAENIYALTLGNKTIGHRSLARYYRQAGGSNGDTRDAVVAGLSAAEMRVSAWRAERKRMTMAQANGQSFALRRRQCFELSVGSSNYYVRKSKLRQNMAVLNSGYRA